MAEAYYCEDQARFDLSYKKTKIYVVNKHMFFTHANIHPTMKKVIFCTDAYTLYRIECILYKFTH